MYCLRNIGLLGTFPYLKKAHFDYSKEVITKNHRPQSVLLTISLLVGCCAVFLTVDVIPKIFTYFSLKHEFPVEVDQIEILEIGTDLYVPKATFYYSGKKHTEYLDSFTENNPYMLAGKMELWSKNVTGYSANLTQCTLQKCFPVKQSIYTLILYGLALYFIFLGKKVKL